MTTTTKIAYGSFSALTVTSLQSLASDSNLLAGWNSGLLDNSTADNVDEIISGLVQVNTSSAPNASTWIEIWSWTTLDDTPTFPDQIVTTQGTVTLTSRNTLFAGAFRMAVPAINLDATASRKYPFAFSPVSVWGFMPKRHGLFIVQNSGFALNSANNAINRAGITYTNG